MTMRSANQTRVSEVLFVLMRQLHRTRTGTLTDWLGRLAGHCHEAAAVPTEEFRAMVVEAVLSLRSAELAAAEASLGACRTSQPHVWAAFEEYRSTFLGRVSDGAFFVPAEFVP